MSLLMDALKKAELAKRQGQGDGADRSNEAIGFDGLTLEPLPELGAAVPVAKQVPEAGTSATAPLSPLASHLEELDAQFLAEAQQAASTRQKPQATAAPPEIVVEPPAPSETSPRASSIADPRRSPSPGIAGASNKSAAQNLFAAKQADKPAARKGFAIAIGVLTVLAVSGIGGYFWWQLQPKSALLANRVPLPPTPPAAPPVAVAPAPTLAPPPPSTTATGPIARMPAETSDEDDQPVATIARAPVRARRPAPRPAPAAEAEADDAPVRVTKAPLQVNPALMRGFDAFNRGELAMAQLEYERVEKSDPRNTDALHGLAAIAMRQGRNEQAELLYRRIVEADPQDTVALSALINSRTPVDPNAAESRLKSLAAAQPELAAPHFSLGNLYARYGRWAEAQQAYFRAYSAEPGNPDILYNLAVSLEHLRQNKLAAQYYGQAITAAQGRSAGFDANQANARLQVLQR
ncbi:MAG: tetratricopeptide repeat protein [Sulfuritalea sp.]|nr:tetratricopeptide repeat protein [Sulfuritalea sp.]